MQSEIVLKHATRTPTMLLRGINAHQVAIRFWNIGGRSKFLMLLQRFRSEFLLAQPCKIEGLDWILLRASQRDEIVDFCRRYGLQIVEE